MNFNTTHYKKGKQREEIQTIIYATLKRGQNLSRKGEKCTTRANLTNTR